jgi:hypothetical protein
LLNSNSAEYLLVGGYAVNHYGYSRATGDMDIWIGIDAPNATKAARALQEFGFVGASADILCEPGKVIRMGVPPLRLEILTSISGVVFSDCYAARETVELDGIPIPVISLADLLKNKRASGRLKDLADVEELE